MTYSFLILSLIVSNEFMAPFGIFGLTLTVMLEKGLIQRFYLNNLTDLLIKALRTKENDREAPCPGLEMYVFRDILMKWYVCHTNQIAALGYVSRTNYIVAISYLAPIPAFGNCFFVNEVMESGGRAQKTRNFGFIE